MFIQSGLIRLLLISFLCHLTLISPVDTTIRIRSPIELNASDDNYAAISLAIVFDSTGSMGNDLRQVKDGAKEILRRHAKKSLSSYIKDFVLVLVHDPDVGPARVTSSSKTFMNYLDSVYTQGGGDCPEMTITGIEMALEASKPNSLIYVFTDSSAKDYNRTINVLNLIQQKQSQVVFVLTGFCNNTNDPGFQAYQQIATVSSGQVYIINKGMVNEFMKVVSDAVETRKVHILQQETYDVPSKTYSFPVDSHLSQVNIQVTNLRTNDPITVKIRDPQGIQMNQENGLNQLMKTVPTVFVGSLKRPTPGVWTLEVTVEQDSSEESDIPESPSETDKQWHSVRITGLSEVDFVHGFATVPLPYNHASFVQPIAGVKNFIMANISNAFGDGQIKTFIFRAPNGTILSRLTAEKTPMTQIYLSSLPLEPIQGHYYIQLTGNDSMGKKFQRFSKVAYSSREPRPVVVTCPAKIEIRRSESKRITCSVESEVPFKVDWYQDDKLLPEKANDNQIYNARTNVSYELKSVNEESQGVYKLVIDPIITDNIKFEVDGQFSDKTAVIVLPPPPTIIIARNVSIEPGMTGSLECTIFSESSDVGIRWSRKTPVQYMIENIPKYEIVNDLTESKPSLYVYKSTLSILTAQESDVGMYLCEAEHKGGKSFGYGFVSFHVKPRISIDNDEVFFKSQSRLVLVCRADSQPPPKFRWFFNKLPVIEDGTTFLQEENLESRLIIRNASKVNSGLYTCEAFNDAGTDSINITTNFISLPEISNMEFDKEMPVEGDRQTMSCRALGDPKPRFKWEFNGSPVSSGENLSFEKNGSTLVISKIDRAMEGIWTCVAENQAGSTKKSQSMRIGYSPELPSTLDYERTIQADFNGDVSLPCPLTGTPIPQIKWYKLINKDKIPVAISDRYILNDDNSLLIKKATMDDAGDFFCEATNMYGKQDLVVRINISGIRAPTISFVETKQIVVDGAKERRLPCTVLDAKPPASVIWSKNYIPLQIDDVKYSLADTHLVIRDIKPEDEGNYMCMASNIVGKAKIEMTLDVQVRPKIINGNQTERISATQGDDFVMSCMATGDPEPKIEWRKEGRAIANGRSDTFGSGPSYVISNKGFNLTVYSIKEFIAGTYTCSAINHLGTDTKEFRLSVDVPPKIISSGDDEHEIGPDDILNLNCYVTESNPPAKISWWKNGKPLKIIPGRIAIMESGKTIEIRGKNGEDTGSYECRAVNSAGTDSKFFQVTVLNPPTFVESDDILYRHLVDPGHSVSLFCEMAGYPVPKITWKWNGKPLETSPELNIEIIDSANEYTFKSYLKIANVQTQLEGNYTCVASNQGGTTQKDFEVAVLEIPKIKEFNDKSVVFVNSSITLTCESSGSPKPNITWYHDGQEINNVNRPGLRYVGNGNLMLLSAQTIHGGNYECIAVNEAGRDSRIAVLTVFESNSGQSKNATLSEASEGGNITFTCTMNSNPPAQLRWWKNDQLIEKAMDNSRYKISNEGQSLEIFNLLPADQGKFKCEATNIPGNVTKEFDIRVSTKPRINGQVSSPSQIETEVGHEIRLRCIAEAQPQATYHWMKDGKNIGYSVQPVGSLAEEISLNPRYKVQESGRELLIESVKVEDFGRFACKAKNHMGEDSINIELNVLDPPKFADSVLLEKPELRRGKPGELWCNVTGNPEPKIEWEYTLPKDGSGDRNLQKTMNGRILYLPSVDTGVVTRYICTATNKAGSVRKVFDPVLIYSPTIISEAGENPRQVVSGSNTRFHCDWQAKPDATVEWFKDGESITANPHLFPSANISEFGNVLSLQNVKKEDSGHYRCDVKNELGKAKRTWVLKLMSTPVITYSSREGEFKEPISSKFSLYCVSSGDPKPDIVWYKDRQEIKGRRVRITDNGVNMVIEQLSEEDSGTYSCEAKNQFGKDTKTFSLVVQSPPRLHSDGQRQYSYERTVNSSMILECLVVGNPKPKIVWYKDNVRLDPMPYRYRALRDDLILEILHLNHEDAGRFQCVAENELGQLEVTIDLSVGAPARIDRQRIKTKYVVAEGSELVLACPARGAPIPRLRFSRIRAPPEAGTIEKRSPADYADNNPDFISSSESLTRKAMVSHERQSLTIFRIEKQDTGTYQCNASNPVGWDIQEYIVEVQTPPKFDDSNIQSEVHWYVNQTRSLFCPLLGDSDTAAKIRWQKHGSPITPGRDVEVSPDGTKLTVHSVQIKDAGEYTCYASNEVGESSQTFSVQVYVRPYFLDSEKRMTIEAIQNQTVLLRCEVNGDPRPQVTWFRKDIEILQPNIREDSYFNRNSPTYQSSAIYNTRMSIDHGDQIVRFLNIQPEDAGEYTCSASNGGGAIEKKFNLTVLVPPRIIRQSQGPTEITASEYIPATLFCYIFDMNSTRPEIIWTKNGAPVLMSESGDYLISQEMGQTLTVVRPTAQDNGNYECIAKNKAGEDQHTFIFSVTAAPKFPREFVRFPERITVHSGSDITLHCPATGTPNPVIAWYHNGAPISLTGLISPIKYRAEADGRQLNFNVGDSKDNGDFKCLATNEAGNITKSYILEVIMPPLVWLDKGEVRELEGATFTIQCKAEGQPAPTIEWSKADGGLFRLGTSVDQSTGLLTISNAKKEDSGQYLCFAFNRVGEDSKGVEIIIIERPKMTSATKPIIVNEGEEAFLPCKAKGSEPIEIQWRRPSGQLISTEDENGNIDILPNQGLIIRNVTQGHAGKYRCQASNEAGSQSAVILLEVQIKPKLLVPNELVVTGREKSVLQLICEVEQGNPAPTVHWERNGIIFSRTRSYYTTTDTGLFIFNSLKENDEGELTCVAKNSAGEDRIVFNINVIVPPKVDLPPSTIGYEDQEVVISCKTEGKPKPEISWQFNGQPVESVLGDRVAIERNNVLRIYSLKPDDDGMYFCIAHGTDGSEARDSTFLTVLTKPKFTEVPDQNFEAHDGRWIQIHCKADGRPKPSIEWTFNNVSIESKSNKNGASSLVMGPVRKTDEGIYACIASNDAGKLVHEFTFSVKSRPQVSMRQQDEAYDESQSAEIRCSITGDADSVIWLKDGQIINNSSRIYIHDSSQESMLSISMTKPADTGRYQCIATNPVGEATGEIFFIVKTKPKILQGPQDKMVKRGEIVYLECSVSGFPEPKIEWYKDNHSVSLDNKHLTIVNNGTLRIIGVQNQDEGKYHCLATSESGYAKSENAKLFVRTDGHWSEWTDWEPCSAPCGQGTQKRERKCNDPAPTHGGSPCPGESVDIKTCIIKFCPQDGNWGSWSPWSSCSETCGRGLKSRKRQCDNPPPTNGGANCEGYPIEDILCEGLPPCAVDGAWSPWSPWSSCSKSCGSGGTKKRQRTCNSPPPINGGKHCPGSSEMISACSGEPCPTDGQWGSWSSWSYCSHSCGGGIKRRQRECNNPAPSPGGADCPDPENSFEEMSCNEEPCAINGEWSNWSSWSACSRTCGVGVKVRSRTCSEPMPQYGGRLCAGAAQQKEDCQLTPATNKDECPDLGIDFTTLSSWSEWSSWTSCQIQCPNEVMNDPMRIFNGVKNRIRKCLTRDGIESNDCGGVSEETESCKIAFSKSSCSVSKMSDSGQIIGSIRGSLNGNNLGNLMINGSWRNMAEKADTEVIIDIIGANRDHLNCLKTLNGIFNPAYWISATQRNQASNGYTVSGSEVSLWDIEAQFADGSSVLIDVQGVYNELKPHDQIKIDAQVSGSCPDYLVEKEFKKDLDISILPSVSQLIQMSHSRGQIHGLASSAFKINTNSSSNIEPYTWISKITTPPGRRQRFLKQLLHKNSISVSANSNGKLTYYALVHTDRPTDHYVCPSGFQLRQSIIKTTDYSSDYCIDIDECMSTETNSCEQLCENYIGGYSCSCDGGFYLSEDGRSCSDVDECTENKNVCPYGECQNIRGSYNCIQVCSQGTQMLNGTCHDVDECLMQPGICGDHQCINLYGSYTCECGLGFQKFGDTCRDINECIENPRSCLPHERCINMPGEFRCESVCREGYFIDGPIEGDEVRCTDINECQLSMTICPRGSTCINQPGGYTCQCHDNSAPVDGICRDYEGHGFNSTQVNKSFERSCPNGYRWNNTRMGCSDIDECNENPLGISPCQFECHNLIGSFKCICPPGYRLNGKTNSCQDIDECVGQQPCHSNQICLNFAGNYTCREPMCPTPYIFDRNAKSCRVHCSNSKLDCPRGSMYADTVQYLTVNLANPVSKSSKVPVNLRVIDWQKMPQANCEYTLLNKTENVPVKYRTQNGMLLFIPDWSHYEKTGDISFVLDSANRTKVSRINRDIYADKLFYMFFRVACFENNYGSFQRKGPLSMSDYSDPINGENSPGHLIFQHSFYVYISFSKYEF